MHVAVALFHSLRYGQLKLTAKAISISSQACSGIETQSDSFHAVRLKSIAVRGVHPVKLKSAVVLHNRQLEMYSLVVAFSRKKICTSSITRQQGNKPRLGCDRRFPAHLFNCPFLIFLRSFVSRCAEFPLRD